MTAITDPGRIAALQTLQKASIDSTAGRTVNQYVSDNNHSFYDINENFVLQVSKEVGGTVEIVNKHTGATLTIWGDPHTHINGVAFKDFYKDSSFILPDGTKVSFGVVKDNGAFYVDTVTLTTADNKYGFQAKNLHNSAALEIREYTVSAEVKKLDDNMPDGDLWQLNEVASGGVKGLTLQDSYTSFGKSIEELLAGVSSRPRSAYINSFTSSSFDIGSLSFDEQRVRMQESYERKTNSLLNKR